MHAFLFENVICDVQNKTITFLAHYLRKNVFQHAVFNVFVQNFMSDSDSTKIIRLLALDFYAVIVDSGFALIEIWSS